MAPRLTRRSFLSLSITTAGVILSHKWLKAVRAETTAEPIQALSPQALNLQSNQVTLSNGVNLYYVERRPEYRRKDNVIIFLHGYTDSWRSFERNLPLLSPEFHLIAIDQRGHGNSTRPLCCYTQADFAADVDAFMTALDIKKATIVGHSMGGFIAHKVAVDYPKRVQQLVLIGAAPTATGNVVIQELNDTVQALEEPIDPAFVRDFQSSTFYNPIPPEFLDTAVSESLKVPIGVWQQAIAELLSEDHSDQLSEIKAPTLILWGDRDGIFTLEDQQTLQTLIPHSILKIYSQTGHGLHVEFPDRFVEDLYTFVKKSW
jgi:pimeloyl-ACP methyl ester carboxylesterase